MSENEIDAATAKLTYWVHKQYCVPMCIASSSCQTCTAQYKLMTYAAMVIGLHAATHENT